MSKATAIEHDVCDEQHWSRAFERAEEKFGPASILVNNAGVATQDSIEDTTLDSWRRVAQINEVQL